MKKKLFIALLAFGLLGSGVSYAQNMDTKANKKDRKAVKKMDKGKPHKAAKKEVKSEKKEDTGK